MKIGPYLVQFCWSVTCRKRFKILVCRDNTIIWAF